GYPHPDHVMCHTVSLAAWEATADAEKYPETGEPWQPLKMYYNMGMSRTRMTAIDEQMKLAGREPVYQEWLANMGDRPDSINRVTTRVPCGNYFEQRDDALRAHATQIDPQGRWFAAPLDIQRAAWPTEDFELAKAAFEVPVPEDDLFAGVREHLAVAPVAARS
ncbi:MAG: mycothiol conjugate amidase Mca, partial [Antricoccus sp.]